MARLSKPEGSKAQSGDGSWDKTFRETIESVVIAFVLAFLFRTFEAEAFVIPTGSMAPTLQGRHKDLDCPKCGYRYRATASGEVEDEEVFLRFTPVDRVVVATTCPMCSYQNADARDETSYNGDRILVAKFPYDFSEPFRWDVVVFKYPGDAKTNYIKRLVGLPGETIRILAGDIYVGEDGVESSFEIQRKPPEKLEAMLQEVYDNAYFPEQLAKANWPERWQAWDRSSNGENSWQSGRDADNGQWFSIDGKGPDEQWIRYQHILPSERDWKLIESSLAGTGHYDANESPRARPQLISDFYAYNSSLNRRQFIDGGGRSDYQQLGMHWVGDLALECEVEIKSDSGELILELVEGEQRHRCRINVDSGEATLEVSGLQGFQPRAGTEVNGPGEYRLMFANADDQLTLWVDGDPVQFDSSTSFNSAENQLKNDLPTTADLAPAGVASNGVAATISRLIVRRDIYYIAVAKPFSNGRYMADYKFRDLPPLGEDALAKVMSDPAYWSVFGEREYVNYPLEKDQFFVLGDNSPFSKDGRLWDNGGPEHYVSRDLFIGKALFIYWPHSEHRIPGTRIPFPFFPNLARMGFVR